MNLPSEISHPELEWLTSENDPGVRYLALRDLVGLHGDDPQLALAKQEAHTRGPLALILDQMHPDGYWVEAGPGYYHKYRSTVWAIILLAQLGGSVEADERILKACSYLMNNTFAEGGYFSVSGAPSGTIDCLQGNLCWALTELGFVDPRLDQAFEWMARSLTGEGVRPKTEKSAPVRYYAYKSGPRFQCGATKNLPCAWGAIKVLMALGSLHSTKHTRLIDDAIKIGVDFIFSIDPSLAKWVEQIPASQNWWKFGFPVFYNTDLLQVAEAMVALGQGHDPRMRNLLQLINDKQNLEGKWILEYDYSGKTWGNYGVKGTANKWVTLRALRVLKAVAQGE